jgi:hypothetical protein
MEILRKTTINVNKSNSYPVWIWSQVKVIEILITHLAIKTYLGVKVYFSAFVTSASHSLRVTPRRNLWQKLNVRLAGHGSRFGFDGEETNLYTSTRIESWFPCHPLLWRSHLGCIQSPHPENKRQTYLFLIFRAARNKTEKATSKLAELRLLSIMENDPSSVITNSGTLKLATWPPAGCANGSGRLHSVVTCCSESVSSLQMELLQFDSVLSARWGLENARLYITVFANYVAIWTSLFLYNSKAVLGLSLFLTRHLAPWGASPVPLVSYFGCCGFESRPRDRLSELWTFSWFFTVAPSYCRRSA